MFPNPLSRSSTASSSDSVSSDASMDLAENEPEIDQDQDLVEFAHHLAHFDLQGEAEAEEQLANTARIESEMTSAIATIEELSTFFDDLREDMQALAVLYENHAQWNHSSVLIDLQNMQDFLSTAIAIVETTINSRSQVQPGLLNFIGKFTLILQSVEESILERLFYFNPTEPIMDPENPTEIDSPQALHQALYAFSMPERLALMPLDDYATFANLFAGRGLFNSVSRKLFQTMCDEWVAQADSLPYTIFVNGLAGCTTIDTWGVGHGGFTSSFMQSRSTLQSTLQLEIQMDDATRGAFTSMAFSMTAQFWDLIHDTETRINNILRLKPMENVIAKLEMQIQTTRQQQLETQAKVIAFNKIRAAIAEVKNDNLFELDDWPVIDDSYFHRQPPLIANDINPVLIPTLLELDACAWELLKNTHYLDAAKSLAEATPEGDCALAFRLASLHYANCYATNTTLLRAIHARVSAGNGFFMQESFTDPAENPRSARINLILNRAPVLFAGDNKFSRMHYHADGQSAEQAVTLVSGAAI